jgi:hypothetical protein
MFPFDDDHEHVASPIQEHDHVFSPKPTLAMPRSQCKMDSKLIMVHLRVTRTSKL